MPALEIRIVASGDDTFRTSGGAAFSSTTDLVVAGLNNIPHTQRSSMRFLNIPLPRNAAIIEAFITLTCNYPNSGTNVLTNLVGNDVDNAVAPTSGIEFSNLVATTATVAWDSPTIPAFVVDVEYNTPSLISIVDEILGRPGWASGNAMQFMWLNDGSDTNARRRAYSYDGSTAKAPLLHIRYSSGSARRATAALLLARRGLIGGAPERR